jgi:Na+/H+ antiporter NhaC
MAILYPIAIPMTWTICLNNQLDQAVSMEILYNVIAVVLSASVMGDHCSPISDTTILSSLASNCNHVQHVNTQLPYALTVGLVSIIMTYLATALGLGLIINLLLGLAVLWGILLFFGKKA